MSMSASIFALVGVLGLSIDSLFGSGLFKTISNEPAFILSRSPETSTSDFILPNSTKLASTQAYKSNASRIEFVQVSNRPKVAAFWGPMLQEKTPAIESSNFVSVQLASSEILPFLDNQDEEPAKDNQHGKLFDQVLASFDFSDSESSTLGFIRKSAENSVIATDEEVLNLIPHNVAQTPSLHGQIPLPNANPSPTATSARTKILSPMPFEPLLPVTEKPQAESATESTKPEINNPLVSAPKPEPIIFVPRTILKRIERIGNAAVSRTWAESTQNNLESLRLVTDLADPQMALALTNLKGQIAVSEEVAEAAIRAEKFEIAAELLRSRYELTQITDVWQATLILAQSQGTQDSKLKTDASSRPFHFASHSRLVLPDLGQQWNDYLLFENLNAAYSNGDGTANITRAARATLARISSPVLSKAQRAVLQQNIPDATLEHLATAAQTPYDINGLLKQMDSFKVTKSGYAASQIANEYQNLLWHVNDQSAQDLAQSIDTHFRNANFRMSISDRMLNGLLPPEQEMHEPVKEQVLGADVRGESRIANRLQLRLIPDSSRIQMRLESIGLMRSSTEASRSGFTVQNIGHTRFHAFRRLAIGQNGIETDRANATSNTENQVVGIGSSLDPIPIVGWMARKLAKRQIDAQQPLTKQIVSQKLESTVTERMESEIDQQLSEMQSYLYNNLIKPLTILELEPTPLEMRSTDSRMVMRYRLAGRDQLAAHTTRPAGLDDCLMSMQIHESAINNMLNRLNLNGQSFSIESLQAHLNEVLGINMNSTDTESLGKVDAFLEFAPYDPIRLSLENGNVEIELNLKRLQIKNSKVWRNLTARATFVPQVNGLGLQLVQDGRGIFVNGNPKLSGRDQIAVCGVFAVLFENQYQIQLLPATIANKLPATTGISQFDVAEGWVGISIDDHNILDSYSPTASTLQHISDSNQR